VLLTLAACGESFAPASVVDDLRVVAARVEVEGKAPRANPDPGDRITITNLVIDRGYEPGSENTLSPPPLQWSLVACVPAPSLLSIPLCDTVIPCEGCEATPPADPLAVPVVSFTVPGAEELDATEATQVVLQGAVCAEGAPAGLDAILAFVTGESDVLNPCQNPENQGRFISVQVPIETDPDNPNDNPEIENVTIAGGAWPPPFDQGVPRDFPNAQCADFLDPAFEVIRAGSPPVLIELAATPESFQTFVEDDMGERVEATEEMQVSWLADGGGFEFSFGFIALPATSVTIQWAPPAFANPQGTLVRFTFPMRDGRGGVDWVERGLCILP